MWFHFARGVQRDGAAPLPPIVVNSVIFALAGGGFPGYIDLTVSNGTLYTFGIPVQH